MAGRGAATCYLATSAGRLSSLSLSFFVCEIAHPCANSRLGLGSCPLPSSGTPPPGSPYLTNKRILVSQPLPHGEGAVGIEPLISNSANQNWSPTSSGDLVSVPLPPFPHRGSGPAPSAFACSCHREAPTGRQAPCSLSAGALETITRSRRDVIGKEMRAQRG